LSLINDCSMLYRSILRPALFRLDPETAHELALHTLQTALRSDAARTAAARRFCRTPFGPLTRFGLTFSNPVGLAAGFDKNGVAVRQLGALGFGFVEVGTVTHQPQPGNPRPRLFRLPADRALINRQGFNNEGAAALARRLQRVARAGVLGINIGKSRVVEVAAAVPDYLASFELIYAHADYVTVNISSPNTPNLRELQRADALAALLGALQQRNRELAAAHARTPVPLLVKVAPDLDVRELELIVDVAQRAQLAGIVATNTTTSRTHLRTPAPTVAAYGAGGLSGAPLRQRATEIVATLYRLARGSLTIIGVGGIFNAADAWAKVCAGASLLQLYTGFVYEGVGIARNINEGLARLARQDGFHTLDEAVGCRAHELSAEGAHRSVTV
jgi:dihydroorotate dehydrogenase